MPYGFPALTHHGAFSEFACSLLRAGSPLAIKLPARDRDRSGCHNLSTLCTPDHTVNFAAAHGFFVRVSSRVCLRLRGWGQAEIPPQPLRGTGLIDGVEVQPGRAA